MEQTKARIIDAFLADSRKAQFELKRKEQQLFEQYPALADIDARFKAAGIAYAKAKILRSTNAEEDYQTEIQKIKKEQQALYEKYGIPEDYLSVRYHCADCKDTGYIGGKLCHCLKARIDEACFARYDLKPSAKSDTFDRFDISLYPPELQNHYQQILKVFTAYCKNFDQSSDNYLFTGTPGLGKTFLCNCVTNALIQKGHSIIYITASNLVRQFRENIHSDQINTSALPEALNECELLIIDDLGAEYNTPFSNNCLFEIINDRIMAQKPMIISTNLPVRDIITQYDERLSSRIRGNFRTIAFRGDDIRLKNRI